MAATETLTTEEQCRRVVKAYSGVSTRDDFLRYDERLDGQFDQFTESQQNWILATRSTAADRLSEVTNG